MNHLLEYLPPDALKIALVLALSFLIGLEREEHMVRDARASFGGVRTFPLIGLVGYGLALVSGPQLLPLSAGLLVVGGLMMLSYRHKLLATDGAGITSEVTALVTYVLGALVYYEHIWIAVALMVSSLLLLELKSALESLTNRISAQEVVSFAKFLLLSAVILPVVPNQSFTKFQINPFKIWLVVVAVSAVSYGSYVLQKLAKGRGGVLLSAILGGAYSSTVTTVVLARQAKQEERPHLFAGSILTASGVMYLRLALLLALFNRALLVRLGPPFAALALLAGLAGWLWSRRPDGTQPVAAHAVTPKNPLEVRAALLFAAIFVFVLVVTELALAHLGHGGVYALAAVMGVSDVDPFILGMAQTADSATTLHVASVGILIAAASNNVAKGCYSLAFADRRTGWSSFFLLLALAAFGIVPWIWN